MKMQMLLPELRVMVKKHLPTLETGTEYDDSLRATAGSREVYIQAYDDDSNFDLNLYEQGIRLAEASIATSQQAFGILMLWLQEKAVLEVIQERHEEIILSEIYPSYVKGEEALILFQWEYIKNLIQAFPPSLHPAKALELYTEAFQHTRLQKFYPYISMGRLCFCSSINGHKSDGPCMYYYLDQYVVSCYYNYTKKFFPTAQTAIQAAADDLPVGIERASLENGQ